MDVPSGLSREAARAWVASEPADGDGVPRLPSTREELAALAHDKDAFDWGFIEDMRKSIVRSKSGVLPGAASMAVAAAKREGGSSSPHSDDEGRDTARDGREQLSSAATPRAVAMPDAEGPGTPAQQLADADTEPSGAAPDEAIARFASAWEALGDVGQEVWAVRAKGQLERLWEAAKMSRRDRDVFADAHCDPPMTASKAVAVAQHLSLLAEHVGALDTIKAAIRAREEGLRLLHSVLADFASCWPPSSDVGGEGSQGLPFSRAGTAAEERRAGTSSRPELAGGKWRARGVTHESGAAAMHTPDMREEGPDSRRAKPSDRDQLSAAERRIVLKHRVRVRALLLHVLRTTMDTVEGIIRWRRTMWRPHSFLWRGKSYLRKVRKDVSFLSQSPASGLLDVMSVPRDEVRILLALWRYPAPGGSGFGTEADPEDDRVGSVLALCHTDLLVPDLRIVGRIDRVVATVHAEKELQRRLRRESDQLEAQGLFVPVLRWQLPGS